MNVSSEQIRAARALLRIEQSELAKRADISVVTVRRLEGIEGSKKVAPITLDGVRRALEEAGAEFVPDGVRLRKVPASDRKAIFEELRALSIRSADRLKGHERLTDADLYDENGLPA